MEAAGLSRREEIAGRVVAAIVALPFTLSALVLPWGRDQGIYAQAADRLLAGHPLYAETFTFKPPLTALFHAISIVLFGANMTAIREWDVFWTLATTQLVYTVAKRLSGDPIAGVAASALYAFTYHQLDYWTSAQTDAWANLPCAVAVILLTTAWADRRKALAAATTAGFALGVAFWFKYTFGAMLAAFAVLPLLRRPPAEIRAHVREAAVEIGAVLLGFVACTAAVVGWMAASGSLAAFVQIQVDVLAPYAGVGTKAPYHGNYGYYFQQMGKFGWPTVILALVGLLWCVREVVLAWRARERVPLVPVAVVGWFFAAMLSAFVQGKFFLYQYSGVIAPLAILSPHVPMALLRRLPADWWRRAALGATTLLFGVLMAIDPFPGRFGEAWRVLSHQTTLQADWEAKGRYKTRDMSLAENLRMADWLARNTPPGEPVFLFTYDPMIYVLAHREMASRFPYTYPFVVTWAPPQYVKELIDDLERQKPSAIVVGSKDATPKVTGNEDDSWQAFQKFDALRDLVGHDYVEGRPIGRFHVFVRRADQPPVAPAARDRR